MRAGSTSARDAQIDAGALNVVVLAAAGSAVVQRLAEIQTVADAAAIIDGKHHVTAVGKVLVEGVGVGVVVHVMPAEQHLAARSAVEEDHGRRGLERLVGRQEKLAVNGEAVGGGEDHLLRRDHVLEREIGGNGGGVQVADAGIEADGGVGGMLGVGAEERRAGGATTRCLVRR